MAARPVRNLLALAVLSYLTRQPMHPYELSKTLRDHGDDRSIKFTHGSLYMVVEQLAKAGFVAPTGTTRQGHRPERTVYALTDAGRAELDQWMRSIVEEPRHEYPDFVAALSLIGALRPADVVRLLARRLERLAELQEEARRVRDDALAAGVHALFVVEEDYRLALLEAEAAFCRGFVARINDSRNGWRADWEEFHRAATARDNGKDDG